MTRHTALLIAMLSLPLCALAQPDEEDDFDEALRSFGLTSGAAYQCVEDAERPGIESDVRKAYGGLVRLFGTDYAFYYAAAFGAGSTMTIDTEHCPEHLTAFHRALNAQPD